MLLVLLIIFILLIFIPLPIFITLTANLTASEIKIYGFRLHPLKEIEKKQKKIKVEKATLLEAFQTLPQLMDSVSELKIKPVLYFNSKIEIGLDDASHTAVAFGMFNSLCPLIYKALSIIFKVTKFNFRAYPDFKNVKLNLYLKCTVIINIFFIIYLMQKTLKLYFILRKNITTSTLKESI